MKQKNEKQMDDNQPGSSKDKPKGPQARGRGLGRGRGRGRGKANVEQKQHDNDCETETAASAPKITSKTKKAEPADADWAAWGTEGAWSQGWTDGWDKEAWAWDSCAYWEAEIAAYELEQQQQAEHDVKSKIRQEHKTRKASNSTKKIAEAEEVPKKKKKTEVRAVSKKAKSREKDVEVETPQIPAKKSRHGEEKNAKKGKDHRQEERHAEERTTKRQKRRQAAQPTAAPEPIAEAAPTEPAAPETAAPEDREVELNVKFTKVLTFLEGFTSLSPKDSLTLMRGRLLSFHRCRMNVYWNRYAVGLHHRKQKVDFAYFKFYSDPNFGSLPSHYLMAAAMKAAEMLATCLSCSCL